jgi:hypothetical protein
LPKSRHVPRTLDLLKFVLLASIHSYTASTRTISKKASNQMRRKIKYYTYKFF